MANPSLSIVGLPPGSLSCLFSYLNVQSLTSLSRCCKILNRIISEEEGIWFEYATEWGFADKNLTGDPNRSWKEVYRQNCEWVNYNLMKHLYAMRYQPLSNACILCTVLGDTHTGKTALIQDFVENKYIEDYRERLLQTTWTAYFRKEIRLNQSLINLTIEEPGLEMDYYSVTGSQLHICCYDVTTKFSFHSLQQWVNLAENNAYSSPTIIVIVGCKSDSTSREVSKEEAMRFANEKQCIYFETSAKNHFSHQPFYAGVQTVARVSQLVKKWRMEEANIEFGDNGNKIKNETKIEDQMDFNNISSELKNNNKIQNVNRNEMEEEEEEMETENINWVNFWNEMKKLPESNTDELPENCNDNISEEVGKQKIKKGIKFSDSADVLFDREYFGSLEDVTLQEEKMFVSISG